MMNYLTDDQWKPTTDLLCHNRLSISQPQPTRTTKAGKNTMLSVVVSTIHGFHPKPLGLNLNNLHKIMLMSVLTPSIVALGLNLSVRLSDPPVLNMQGKLFLFQF